MKTTLRIFLFSAIVALNANAQENGITCKGDKYFDRNDFEMAKKCYISDMNARNKRLAEHSMSKLADCYRIMGEFDAAEATYKKILKRKKSNPKNYLNYGLSLKSSAKFEEAKFQFQEYIKLNPSDPMGPVYLRSCDSAQVWLDETIGKEVTNVRMINTQESDFSPFIVKNKLYFCSSGNNSKKALISFEGGNEVKRMDIFSVITDLLNVENGDKDKIVNLSGFNTTMHDGSPCFSKDGSEMYFTRTIKGKKDDWNDITNLLQIFHSKKDSLGNWSKPTSVLAMNSTKYSTFHPALSHDGSTLFFASDKPGGYGKTDIYFCKKNQDGTWGKMTNAGNGINTFGHELFPAIFNDSVLYFSSNAHPGMGQLDVFKSKINNGKWSDVQNLKPPVNSIGNDFGISFDGETERGFFSSDRFNGQGAEDIYAFSEDVPLRLTVSDDTLKFDDKKIFDGIKYKLVNETDSTERELNPENGKYTLKLDNRKYYSLIAKKNGFTYNKIDLRFINDTSTNDIHVILKSEWRPVLLNGQFSSAFYKKMHERGEYLIKFSSIESTPTTINVDESGRFSNYKLIRPASYYFLYSQIIYP